MSTSRTWRYALRVLVGEILAGVVSVLIFTLGGRPASGQLGLQVATIAGGVLAGAIIYVAAVAMLLRRAGANRGSLELLAVAPHSFVACLVAVGAAHPGAFIGSAIVAPVLVWWRSTSATVR